MTTRRTAGAISLTNSSRLAPSEDLMLSGTSDVASRPRKRRDEAAA